MASRCPCCMTKETTKHRFLECSIVRQVWNYFHNMFGMSVSVTSCISSRLMYWFMAVGVDKLHSIIPLSILWFTWLARNAFNFRGESFSAALIIFRVEQFVFLLCKAEQFSLTQIHTNRDVPIFQAAKVRNPKQRVSFAVCWEKPPQGKLKLNTDASIVCSLAFGGGVLRNSDGKVIQAFYKEFGEGFHVLEAELLSLWFGIKFCLDKGFSGFLVEVDNEALVKVIKSKAVGCWSISYTLETVHKVIVGFNLSISHVFREANRVADSLAGLKGIHSTIFEDFHMLPSGVWRLVVVDASGLSSIRLISFP